MAAIHSGTDPKVVNGLLLIGNCIDVLGTLAPGSCSLCYVDPPFGTEKKGYHEFAVDDDGYISEAQGIAYRDVTRYDSAAIAYNILIHESGYQRAIQMIDSLEKWVPRHGRLALITFLTAMFIKIHQVLPNSGVIVVQCDDRHEDYIKLALDAVFGDGHLISKITRKRHSTSNNARQSRRLGRSSDKALCYRKGLNKTDYVWHPVYKLWTPEEIYAKFANPDNDPRGVWDYGDQTAEGGKERGNPIVEVEYRGTRYKIGNTRRGSADSQEEWEQAVRDNRVWVTKSGSLKMKRYLSEIPPEDRGNVSQDIWDEPEMYILPKHERAGWGRGGTQKPVAYVKRIIALFTNPGDTVIDPCSGCGTTPVAAHQSERSYIGIDISHSAIDKTLVRIERECPPDLFGKQLPPVVDGYPREYKGAVRLWNEPKQGKYKYQIWVCRRYGFTPGKRGADGNLDGQRRITKDGIKFDLVVCSVKGGERAGPDDVSKLRCSMQEQGAKMGVLFVRDKITQRMRDLAIKSDYHEGVPAVQILTLRDVCDGKQLELPKRKA